MSNEDVVKRLFAIKARRSELAAESERLKAEAEIIGQQLIERLRHAGGAAAQAVLPSGATGMCMVVAKDDPKLESWEQLSQHILNTKSLDLLEKRVSSSGVRARWQEGLEVPGIAHNLHDELSMRTVKAAT